MESALRIHPEPGLTLIETLGWDGQTLARLPAHLARMAGTAAALGWGFDPSRAEAALRAVTPRTPARMRLTFDGQTFQATAAPLPPARAEWRLTIAPQRLDPADPWLAHKTSHRALYDATRAALPDGVEEVVFLNTRGEVCEGTITNLFFDRGQGLCTPPLGCGLLPGILRAERIAGGCREQVLRADDLPHVRLWVGNALRGLIPARLI